MDFFFKREFSSQSSDVDMIEDAKAIRDLRTSKNIDRIVVRLDKDEDSFWFRLRKRKAKISRVVWRLKIRR